MKIKKGDTVNVIIGKDAGKRGKIVKVQPEELTVGVEGVNIFKKHIKGDGQKRESSIVDLIKPVPVSNVMVICKSCSKPTRVGFKEVDGKKKRFCKKCGKFIDGADVKKPTAKSKAGVKAKSKSKTETKPKAKPKGKQVVKKNIKKVKTVRSKK